MKTSLLLVVLFYALVCVKCTELSDEGSSNESVLENVEAINTEHTEDEGNVPEIVDEVATLADKEDCADNGTCQWTWLGVILGIYGNDSYIGDGDGHVAMEMEEQEKVEEDDDVPSFSEFKQKMFDQGIEQRDDLELRPSSGASLTKNYASIECGAKVIETNPGARNPSAILNTNKDDYLINDCSSHIYFIVELCELISVRSIMIASMELFSSIPKSFKVSVAERFPDLDEEWTHIGTFHALNHRDIQQFPLNNEEHVYAKFIKVVMVSHYGNERVCPINIFKVIGASMMEIYEESQSSDIGTASQASVIPLPASEGLSEEDTLWDDAADNVDSKTNGTLLSAAKDAVLRILEQPLEILGKVMKPDGKATVDNQIVQDNTAPSLPETPDGEHAQKENGEGHLTENGETTRTMEAGNDEEAKDVHEEAKDMHGGSVVDVEAMDTVPPSESFPNRKSSMGNEEMVDKEAIESEAHERKDIIDSYPTDNNNKHEVKGQSHPMDEQPCSFDCQTIVPSDQIDPSPNSLDDTLSSNKEEENDTHSHTKEESIQPSDNPSILNSGPCTLISEQQVSDSTEQDEHAEVDALGPDLGEETTSTDGFKEASSKVNDIHSDKDDDYSPSTVTMETKVNVSQSVKNGSLSDHQDPVSVNDIHTSEEDLLGPTLAPDTVTPPSGPTPANDEGVVNEPPRAAPGTAPDPDPDVGDNRLNGVSDSNGLSAKHLPPEGHSADEKVISPDEIINGKNSDNSTPTNTSEIDVETQSKKSMVSKSPVESAIPTSTVLENESMIDDTRLHHDDVITQHPSGTTEPDQPVHTIISPQPTTQDIPNTLSEQITSGIDVELNTVDAPDSAKDRPVANVISSRSMESLVVEPTPHAQSKQTLNGSSNSWNSNSSSVNASNITSANGNVTKNELLVDPVVPATPTLVTNGNGVHTTQPREKEKSVFLRLSNQIRELEMNMTLFSSYLDQISTSLKRNRNRTEDTSRSLDKRVTALNETVQLLRNETNVKVKALQQLSSELSGLARAVINVSLDLATLDEKIFLSLLIVAGIQTLFLIPLFFLCCLYQWCSQRSIHREIQIIRLSLSRLEHKPHPLQGARSHQNGLLPSSLAHDKSPMATRLENSTGIGELSNLILSNDDGTDHRQVQGVWSGPLGSASSSSLSTSSEDSKESWTVAGGKHKKKCKSKLK